MALSDYLTSDEWDACLYVHFTTNELRGLIGDPQLNFRESMQIAIDGLLKNGYKFSGLDSNGAKKQGRGWSQCEENGHFL